MTLLTTWTTVNIRSICQVVRGASPRPAGDPRFFDGDFLPWITVADVTGSKGLYLHSTKSRLTKEGAKFTRVIEPATLIITNSGATLGVPKITTFTAGANDGIAMFLNLKGATREFLYYVLESKTEYFRNHLAPGMGQPNLNTDLLGDVTIFLPPLAEQEKVVAFLKNWDTAIEKTERLIAAEERRREALGLLLLRIPAKPGRPKWMIARADELFQSVNERGSSDEEILSVTQDRGVIPRRLLDKRILMESSDMSTFKLVQAGDFVISLRSFQGGLEYSAYHGLVSPAYSVLRPNATVYADYFRHYLKSRDFLKRLSVAVVGIRDGKQISFSDFASIKIPVPPKDVQKRRAEIFDLLDKEIALVRKQLDLLQTQKRGLMQKLLTGQWRVKVADTEAA